MFYLLCWATFIKWTLFNLSILRLVELYWHVGLPESWYSRRYISLPSTCRLCGALHHVGKSNPPRCWCSGFSCALFETEPRWYAFCSVTSEKPKPNRLKILRRQCKCVCWYCRAIVANKNVGLVLWVFMIVPRGLIGRWILTSPRVVVTCHWQQWRF